MTNENKWEIFKINSPITGRKCKFNQQNNEGDNMSSKNKGGRPSKLTPELQEEIVISIKRGDWTETTCATVGIDKSTFYAWMKRGKKETRHTRYKKFYEEVKRAQAISEARAVAIISKAAEKYWKAGAWMLERKYPEKWGKSRTKMRNTS